MAGDQEEAERESPAPAAERVATAVETVAAPGEFRNAYRRQLLALSRRIRLLGPFAEELRERRRPAGEEEERALAPLADALEKALELLKFGREGSRISLVRPYLPTRERFLISSDSWSSDAPVGELDS